MEIWASGSNAKEFSPKDSRARRDRGQGDRTLDSRTQDFRTQGSEQNKITDSTEPIKKLKCMQVTFEVFP